MAYEFRQSLGAIPCNDNQAPVDMNDLSRETVELLVPDAAARGARIQTNLHNTPVFVCGNRVQLQRVLLNLVLNGLDALAHTAPEHRYLVVSTAIHNSQAEVSVRDRGSGIPVPAMHRMFEPFFSTKTDGMGMGLAIARDIVQAHRGRIVAENNADRGATFRVFLPLRHDNHMIFQHPVVRRVLSFVLAVAMFGCGTGAPPAPAGTPSPSSRAPSVLAEPLASWNEGSPKSALVDFVGRVTREGGPEFVPQSERIATFDNDGTLWSEQPIYFQIAFALDRVKALAPHHPEWKTEQPFKGVLEDDMKALAASGERGLLEIVSVTHAGTTTREFEGIVKNWIESARHSKTNRLYTEMVYQPMLEVLAYLRANGFKTFIVSGGGVEFMRPWVERVYGIPPEQVIGSRAKVKYEVNNGIPVLLRLAEIDHVDDKAGKPVGIHQVIGRRPIAAFGNSDGDFEMLEWITSAPGPRFGLIVHHTDAEREWAYDRISHVGQLARGLDEAPQRGWIVVDMKRDWKVIYPPAK